MKRIRLTKTSSIALLLAVSVPFVSHHSLAFYDQTNLITITGVVEKLEWINPHAGITLRVTNSDGKSFSQQVQIAAPAALMRKGLERAMLQIGNTVTVETWLPKDPGVSTAPNGRNLILADGRRFDVGDAFGNMRTKDAK